MYTMHVVVNTVVGYANIKLPLHSRKHYYAKSETQNSASQTLRGYEMHVKM